MSANSVDYEILFDGTREKLNRGLLCVDADEPRAAPAIANGRGFVNLDRFKPRPALLGRPIGPSPRAMRRRLSATEYAAMRARL